MSSMTIAPVVPLTHPPQTRRVATRKGSIAAPDPLARHASADTPRKVKSRLTIIRAPQEPLADEIPTITLGKPRLPPSEYKTNSSLKLRHADGAEAKQRPTRLSFAKSRRSPGPQYSPKSRSNSFGARGTPLIRRPTLAAQQICDLAASSLTAASKVSPTTPNAPSLFRPIPASYYLPFLDRPEEVSLLLDYSSNALLMTLISRTFPSHLRAPPASDPSIDTEHTDPTQWSYPALSSYIRTCPREVASDMEWVGKVRTCIRVRSELMWERLREILGVPPELDEVDPCHVDDLAELSENHEEHEEAADVDAWLRPGWPAQVHMVASPATMTSPGMETIGESDEEAECGGDAILEEKEEDHGMSALRLGTVPLYVPGIAVQQDAPLKAPGPAGQPQQRHQQRAGSSTLPLSPCSSSSTPVSQFRRQSFSPLFPGSFHGIGGAATPRKYTNGRTIMREDDEGPKPPVEKVAHAGL
ncbi:hypothetical protein BU17DRAFT_93618 [Hysterangium stoloniferum]|nr:hypothetical protein BU17DRAFT_93618 [Hysterangium stoloniferum]